MDPSDYMKDPRPVPASQLTMGLPAVNTIITTHDSGTGKSSVHSTRTAEWTHMDDKQWASSTVYTMAYDTDLTDEKDLQESDEMIEEARVPLVRQGGSIAKFVDFSPGYETPPMRTVTVDLCILLEGRIEMILEDGSETTLRKGDTVVLRGGMHSWRNPEKETWARLMFVMQSIPSFKVDGKDVQEKIKEKQESHH